ncbi:hypothetical protein PCAR4_60056 [Paraburkholderia caribensis]|nr:hypothetical protein PCAR4_60056 [Paraburkholderia caribensis]
MSVQLRTHHSAPSIHFGPAGCVAMRNIASRAGMTVLRLEQFDAKDESGTGERAGRRAGTRGA